jgi:hypothetical protein
LAKIMNVVQVLQARKIIVSETPTTSARPNNEIPIAKHYR